MVNISYFLWNLVTNSAKRKSTFIDSLRLYLKAGDGGNGKPHFGGVGGNGGDIFVVGNASSNFKRLTQEYPERRVTAESGGHSRSQRIVGEFAKVLEVHVPLGIVIKTDDGATLGSIDINGDKVLVAKGGRGGNAGNQFQGQPGQTRHVNLDLRLIANVGLVGFPNAGKSTFLRSISRATPKIASYPFTTIQPNIGIMGYDDKRQISVADLPGLIEGAHVNAGMGHSFLKHVERTQVLLFVIDIQGFQLGKAYPHRNAFETLVLLIKELQLYDGRLLYKPAILAVNKMDTEGADRKYEELLEAMKNVKDNVSFPVEMVPERLVDFDHIITMSTKYLKGTEDLKHKIRNLMDYYALRNPNELALPGGNNDKIKALQASNKTTDVNLGRLVKLA